MRILSTILYIVLQWTWGILQNLIGGVLWLYYMLKNPERGHGRFHQAIVVNWDRKSSMGMGMFIFFGHAHLPKKAGERILVHEFGHTVQSAILGPFYLFVIGLPSWIWANTKRFERKRESGRCSYYDFFPERWANFEGERVLKLPAPESKKTE